jgi:putative flippase GtrA
MVTRAFCFSLLQNATISAAIANIIAILFAFFTNDKFVFNQATKGWLQRLIKFIIARLATFVIDIALAYLLVTRFPNLIGQFVNHNMDLVNTIEALFAQVLIIVLNYVFSKLFVFEKNS